MNLISEKKNYDQSIEIENDVSPETPTDITDKMGKDIAKNYENSETGDTFKNNKEQIIPGLNNTYIDEFVMKEKKGFSQENIHEVGSETDKFANTKNNESAKNVMDKKDKYLKATEIPVEESDNQIVQTNDKASLESEAETENFYDDEVTEKDVKTAIPKTIVDEALENYIRHNLNTTVCLLYTSDAADE